MPAPILTRPTAPPPVPVLLVIGSGSVKFPPAALVVSKPSWEPAWRPLAFTVERFVTSVATSAAANSPAPPTGSMSVVPERKVRLAGVQLAVFPP